ncbi:TIGR04282 family arsenosugar biosynthesis glycosyltransferase [Cryptosporangium phraense]|uniref:DUF2064 domain-containing protein n=1 Tax=Cryptosporangium phraense TaxID=2593070 RepID=A0A545AP23_9ACTN|nr:DUF2064 domain-containing protein [Cryptosporangium phraense]TQS43084.1 DUF2064 domain-containing protein [Cryptosporangium phraense]
MNAQILVIAKAPVPGRVKTRLCPPCTAEEAAVLAEAALADTVAAVSGVRCRRRVLVLAGEMAAPVGFEVVAQRGVSLGSRLAAGFADTARVGVASFLIGMDTPQVSPGLLTSALGALAGADAVLGPAEDGGWWGLGLRNPRHASVLRDVPTSTATTGERTLDALRERGLRVGLLPVLRDVDTIADAEAVAELVPGSRFARALAGVRPGVAG